MKLRLHLYVAKSSQRGLKAPHIQKLIIIWLHTLAIIANSCASNTMECSCAQAKVSIAILAIIAIDVANVAVAGTPSSAFHSSAA